MVLVAQLEPLEGVAERDVTRFIVEDLTQTLENDIPFSNIRIREYPTVIASEDAAQDAAAANHATIIVWGNYTPAFVEVRVQIGVTGAFKYIHFDRKTLERSANNRVRLTDEHEQSVVLPVLLALEVLFSADGDSYEVSRSAMIINELKLGENAPEVVGSGISTYHYRGKPLYMTDTAQAVDLYDAAVALDPSNAIFYYYRGNAYLRIGDFEHGLADLNTALRLGPDDWALPLTTLGPEAHVSTGPAAALPYYDQIVALRPDDWFAYTYRAILHYELREYALAEADALRAIELGPEANFPYMILSMVMLREGRIADAQAMVQTILTRFPDPMFGIRMMQVAFGDQLATATGSLAAAGIHLFLGQYDEALQEVADTLALNDELTDAYLIRGVAYCNLGDYEAAQAAYSTAIALEPEFKALYLLRAEVRLKTRDLAGAAEDMTTAQAHDLDPEFDALLDVAMTGQIGCKNFFDYDLRDPASAPSSTTAPSPAP
jgi:tetratricopeptide (TPR) repeat protein